MIIIPDTHGRYYWRKVADNMGDEKIIFLGDYLDPYPDEFPNAPLQQVRNEAIDNFKEIINFKKEHMDRVILLVGNHDLGYFVSRDICSCRSDVLNYQEIKKLFNDNKSLFKLCHKEKIGEKSVIFSHAGIRNEWIEKMGYKCTDENVVEYLNNKYDLMVNSEYPSEHTFATELGIYSYWRGYTSNKYGSPVWSDVREWISSFKEDLLTNKTFNIFGHTRAKSMVYSETFAMLDDGDNPRGFMFDQNGLYELDGKKINYNIDKFF